MKYPFDFSTSYSQFYIHDKGSSGNIGSNNFWTNDAYNDRLAIAEGTLGVGTECYGPVKGELFLLDVINTSINFNDYDHIVEGGIDIKSGIIQILNCPVSSVELEICIDPGLYRARIYSSNLVSVEGGEEGDDFYTIEIWPDTKTERKVLKRYHGK